MACTNVGIVKYPISRTWARSIILRKEGLCEERIRGTVCRLGIVFE